MQSGRMQQTEVQHPSPDLMGCLTASEAENTVILPTELALPAAAEVAVLALSALHNNTPVETAAPMGRMVVLLLLALPGAPGRGLRPASSEKALANYTQAVVPAVVHTSADTVRTPDTVAQAAEAAAELCTPTNNLSTVKLMARPTPVAAVVVGLATTAATVTEITRPVTAARASSVCAYTKNKHGLRFGGRERRFIWQLQAER